MFNAQLSVQQKSPFPPGDDWLARGQAELCRTVFDKQAGQKMGLDLYFEAVSVSLCFICTVSVSKFVFHMQSVTATMLAAGPFCKDVWLQCSFS